jgi:hypothetical protein
MLALPLVALTAPSSRVPSKSQQTLLYTGDHAGLAAQSSGAAPAPVHLAAEYKPYGNPCPGLACSLGLWPLPRSLMPKNGDDEGSEGPESSAGAITRHDAKKKNGKRCKGLTSWATNLWCNQACKPAPYEKYCKDVCDCPDPNQGSADDPPPPEPRIFGGWTDCGGYDTKSFQKAFVHHRPQPRDNRTRLEVPHTANCTRDEESIMSALGKQDPNSEWIGMGMGRGARHDPSFQHTWGVNAILPGRFGGGSVAPIIGKPRNYNYFWLTFGGQGTNSKGWEVTAEQDVIDAGAKGAAFDMEGGVMRDAVFTWVAEMRKKHPEWTYVHVPQAHDVPIPYKPENQGLPDFVAPMLYYSNFDSYPDMDISKKGTGEDIGTGESVNEAKYALLRLKKAGWPASRTILTYQSFDAARVRNEGDDSLLPFLGKLLGDFSMETKVYGEPLQLKGPYAGVLGWPAQCGEGDFRCWPEADRSNVKQLLRGARSSGVKGLGPEGE